MMSDTYGDSFCCAWGSGPYYVNVNSQPVITEGGSSSASETMSIDCATNPTPAPIVLTDIPSETPSDTPSDTPIKLLTKTPLRY